MTIPQQLKKQKEPVSDSEPMSSDSDYCTGGCERPRSPIKTPLPKRRATCREKCGYQYRESPDSPQKSNKLCVCCEDSERGNDSPPFIDVYKREDKGKFISDSSSTVCNEEVCPFLKNFAICDNRDRARGGNDSNNPCPAENFPNFQYTEVVDGAPVTQAIDANAVNCGVNDIAMICGNVSCQTQGCDEFQGDLGPPIAQCDIGSCLNTTCEEEEREIGVKNLGAVCSDRSCPKKDYYPPVTRPYVYSPPEGGTTEGPVPTSGFPISCTDSTCLVLGCSGKGDTSIAPLTQSFIPPSDFPITCNDASCQIPGCSSRAGYTLPSDIPPTGSFQPQGPSQAVSPYPVSGSPDCACVNAGMFPTQIDPNCPCAIKAGIVPVLPIQPAFAPEGVPRKPSICICGMPEECQKEGVPPGRLIDQQASSFARPPTQSQPSDGRCPRGVCETCVCVPFPSTDGRPHSGVPPPPQSGGGRCPRGLCDTCACIMFPGVTAGGGTGPMSPSFATKPSDFRGTAAPSYGETMAPSLGGTTAQSYGGTAAPSYGGTRAPGGNEEVCAICGCRLTPSDVMKGKTCDMGVNPMRPTMDTATSVQVERFTNENRYENRMKHYYICK